MNHLIEEPQGLDIKIQEAQILLYNNLVSEWGDILEGYGRVYKNEKDGVVIPEIFIGGKDYSNNLIGRSSKFFFSKSSSSQHQDIAYQYKSSVNIYFIVDLSKAKGELSHRADQEVQIDVLDILEITGIVVKNIIDTGAEEVFKEFKGSYKQSKFDDMHPFHVFKCECEIIYDLTKR